MAHPLIDYDEEGTDLTTPGEVFELYHHNSAEMMRSKNWHRYY